MKVDNDLSAMRAFHGVMIKIKNLAHDKTAASVDRIAFLGAVEAYTAELKRQIESEIE